MENCSPKEAGPYRLLAATSEEDTDDVLCKLSSEDGKKKIRLLLGDWLRMENVVVLAGAGCSLHAGGSVLVGSPPGKWLEDRVWGAIKMCGGLENAKKIIETRDDPEKREVLFEEWISHFFAHHRHLCATNSPVKSVCWKTTDGSVELPREELAALVELIEKSIFLECDIDLKHVGDDNQRDSTTGHARFVSALIARDTKLGRTHLFTLNYDTLFEQAMDELGIHYFDGFVGGVCPHYDPNVYDLDIHRPGGRTEGRVRRIEEFMHFYKLHGSINWVHNNDRIFRLEPPRGNSKDYRLWDQCKKAEFLEEGDFKPAPYAILPTSEKLAQTLSMPFGDIFRLFRERLSQPQTFFLVIGCGLGDEHVNLAIERALANPSLVMLVVDPCMDKRKEDLLERHRRKGSRLFILTSNPKCPQKTEGDRCSVATFDDFARNIMPNVKAQEEYIRLKKLERDLSPRGGTDSASS